MALVMGMINALVLAASGIVGANVGIVLFAWAAGGAVENNPRTMALTFIVCVMIAIYSGANLIALWIAGADHK